MKVFIVWLSMALWLYAASFKAVIDVKGMTCPMCTTAVKKSLQQVKGVDKVKVRLNTNKATVWMTQPVKEATLIEAIKRVGYDGQVEKIIQNP